MSFEIPKVENPSVYLDVAFKKARNKASQKRTSLKADRLRKSKVLEFIKIDTVNDTLNSKLVKIISSFPNFDNLTEFYTELVKTLIDYKELKKSLGAMNWAKNKIADFSKQYRTKIRKCNELLVIRRYGKEYYGRISSVIKQISKNLYFLEETRKIMREFPSVKDGLFTVAIFGFPNIGKTTLLSKLTTSKPEIKPYAFTTKKLNIGYLQHKHRKIQFIDTPGSLNRLDKMNSIEKTAYLAVKYCAHTIVYIYDLTESYPLKDQKKLLKKLKEFDKPIIIYLSKTDIIDKEKTSAFKHSNKGVVVQISTLKNKIIEEFNNYHDEETS
ncbi:MAG: 50S ribosome-binding GTPase [Nanoarchaeota archaeon]|nr:50S ribosome-binding GTPase [DPANN group archaeon]MBL7117008.1 50S ribosome-binding GTPase [Nanoarchaeota archaeon]